MIRLLTRLATDRRGVGAIEYALIASLIAVAAIGGMSTLGDKQGDQWNSVDNKL